MYIYDYTSNKHDQEIDKPIEYRYDSTFHICFMFLEAAIGYDQNKTHELLDFSRVLLNQTDWF